MRTGELPEVRALPLFATMAEGACDDMLQGASLQSFPTHVDLIVEGGSADFLHVVVDGCVELFATANGRESTMAMVRPVGTFILAAVVRDAPYLMSARTCSRSRILMVPAENVRATFENDAHFARAIVRELAACYRTLVKAHKEVKLRSAVERLANRLLRYDTDQGGTGSVVLPCDKRTLASMLTMTPENLSRAFNTLGPYGVVVKGATIKLTDIKALTALAKPDRLIDDRAV